MDMQAAAAYNPGQVPQRPYVQFEFRAMEDRRIDPIDGVTQMRDVAWAVVRAPGSKDSVEKLAVDWIEQLKAYGKDGRIPATWYHEYKETFALWLKGEEIPIHGTAIKTWSPLTPAQRKNIIAVGILTVQDLAQVNDETRDKIGMGGHSLQQMAQRWIVESKDAGATAKQLEAALIRQESLENTVAELSAQVKALLAAVPSPGKVTK